MKLLVGQSKLGLEADQLVTVRHGKGVRVVCCSGTLWVTQEREAADVILEAGQSTVIDSSGLTLVMALQPSTLRIAEPRGVGLWNAVRGWFRAPLTTATATC